MCQVSDSEATMTITLIKAQYNQLHELIIFKLKTDYGNLDFAITEKFEMDWNWEDYRTLAPVEKAQIEAFIKQYLFDKLKEVVW